MQKKILLLCCFFALSSACLKAQFNVNNVYHKTDRINLSIYKGADALKLLNDYNQLLADNANLQEQLSHEEYENRSLSLEIKYRYIREQIESRKFMFYRNGAVLPEYVPMVAVVTDTTGRISQITIISVGTSFGGRYISTNNDVWIRNLFMPDSALAQGYPVTSRLVTSGFIQFVDNTSITAGVQIERITFPYLIAVNGPVQQKKKYNDMLLGFIKSADKTSRFSGLLPGYLALEKREVPSGGLDQTIAFREQFIIQFKKLYDATNSH